jgi:hypothetical protein
MGFLSGTITFECFRIKGSDHRQFGPKHIQTLKRFAIGQIETSSPDQADVGFLGGEHLFDGDFDLGKNVIADALHCGLRIDTHKVPAAVRKAWLQMELAAAAADTPGGRPTKVQRQQAKEAVEARCQQEVQEGKYRKMQQFPLLWDMKKGLLFFGGTSAAAAELCCDLCSRAFGLELERLTAGKRVLEWAADARQRKSLEEISPSAFQQAGSPAEIAWWNNEAGNFDFLGNEFLLWLWWRWEAQSDTIKLPDGSDVTGMFARTLGLQCPRDESGKETITAEAPTRLPEAIQAIRSGKLPRKSGLILVRYGEQYELVLQAETFTVSGARIRSEDSAEGRAVLEDRVESLRGLHETVDLLFRTFCARRIGNAWPGELDKIRRWLKADPTATRTRSRQS